VHDRGREQRRRALNGVQKSRETHIHTTRCYFITIQYYKFKAYLPTRSVSVYMRITSHKHVHIIIIIIHIYSELGLRRQPYANMSVTANEFI